VASAKLQMRALDSSRHEITVEGRLYAGSAGELRKALEAVVPRARAVLVDATRLEAIDAAALKVFVDALKQLRAQGGTMIFYGLTPANRRLFEITGMDRVATVVAHRDEALGAAA
jgi:anti-anti-sigma factor